MQLFIFLFKYSVLFATSTLCFASAEIHVIPHNTKTVATIDISISALTLFTKETVFHSCINIIFWVQEFPFNFNLNVNVHNNGSECTRVLVRISISSIGLILKARRQSGAHPITSVLGTERINEYTSMDHITGPIVV